MLILSMKYDTYIFEICVDIQYVGRYVIHIIVMTVYQVRRARTWTLLYSNYGVLGSKASKMVYVCRALIISPSPVPAVPSAPTQVTKISQQGLP